MLQEEQSQKIVGLMRDGAVLKKKRGKPKKSYLDVEDVRICMVKYTGGIYWYVGFIPMVKRIVAITSSR